VQFRSIVAAHGEGHLRHSIKGLWIRLRRLTRRVKGRAREPKFERKLGDTDTVKKHYCLSIYLFLYLALQRRSSVSIKGRASAIMEQDEKGAELSLRRGLYI
jgi:hypothetical protein